MQYTKKGWRDVFEREERVAKEYQDSLKRQGKARYYCNVKASRLQGPLLKNSPYLESREDRILKLRQLALKISSDQQGKGGSAFDGRFEICDSVLGRGRKSAKFGSDGVFECGGEFGDSSPMWWWILRAGTPTSRRRGSSAPQGSCPNSVS